MYDINYSPLHVHTAYDSFLDSTNTPKKLVARVKELGMKACAVTGHGYCSSHLMFYNECVKENIKPILGMEAYFTPNASIKDNTSRYDHLILLAKTQEGYKNILKLSSLGFLEGFYYKPRIDYKMLERYSKGIIATSACLGGTIQRMILRNENDLLIKEQIRRFNKIFEKFYLEIQAADNKSQKLVNEKLIQFSKELGIKLIVTTDAHFLTQDDFEVHGTFIKINQDRENEAYQDCWLKSVDEIVQVLTSQGISKEVIEESIENTNEIADMCNVRLEQGKSYLPNFPIPATYKDEVEYLKNLINKGFVRRGLDKKPNIKEYLDRIFMEFDVITKKDYTGYFLITGDFLEECRNKNIPTGDGRGSCGASLICYCLGITNIDPIAADLDFSRFLTMERKSLPDIDNDVSSIRKADAVNILRDKYGYDKVAQICTFLTMQSKATLGKIGKVYDIPYSEIEKMRSKIADGETIKENLENNGGLIEYRDKYPDLFRMGEELEGLPVGISIHAGGVVICPSHMEMQDFTGLCLGKKSEIITQFEMHDIESVGLVKMDILATAVLDILDNAMDFVEKGEY